MAVSSRDCKPSIVFPADQKQSFKYVRDRPIKWPPHGEFANPSSERIEGLSDCGLRTGLYTGCWSYHILVGKW